MIKKNNRLLITKNENIMVEVQKQLERILMGDIDRNIDSLSPKDYSDLQNIIFLSSEIKKRSINI